VRVVTLPQSSKLRDFRKTIAQDLGIELEYLLLHQIDGHGKTGA
jgi:hypothetical protein